MVKNYGGNKGKKMARKHVGSNNYNAKLRISEDEDEIYACVTKLLGNGMCHVNCLDPNDKMVSRLCMIRNKFRGRGKRDNQIKVGSYVLVGVRSWETLRTGSLEKCDLVEVYNGSEVDKLKSQVDKKWNIIHVAQIMESSDVKEDDDMFVFGNENSELQEEILQKMNDEKSNESHSGGDFFGGDEDFDIDDI